MKTCAYCGRDNEDVATQCRECGTTEFVVTSVSVLPPPQQPDSPRSFQRRGSGLLRQTLLIFAGIAFLLFGALWVLGNGNPIARAMWKNRAITQINALTANTNWMVAEREKMQAATNEFDTPNFPDPWLSRNLIVMTNGEWLVYRNICRKQDFWIRDLFIARGSDGRWYYSTYHFCINMFVLGYMGKGQPGSLAEFSKDYFVEEFNGHSSKCLQKTW